MALSGITNLTQTALTALQGTSATQGTSGITGQTGVGDIGTSFGEFLNNAINELNDQQIASQQMTNDFVTGKTENIHSVLITAEEASTSMQLALEVRNKVLDAYSEIMRMQI